MSTPGPLLDGALTPSQLAQFHADGYLLLPSFFDAAPALARAQEIVRGFRLEGHPLTRFSTGAGDGADAQDAHVGDRYFLESGDKVRFFLEEEALAPAGSAAPGSSSSSGSGSGSGSGSASASASPSPLRVPPSRAVNKVGHGLHLLDAFFHALSFSPRLQALARSLGAHADPRVLQSMIICKQPAIGGAVPHHNDSTFLYTDPPSAVGLWFALEDCTVENGCLSFLPGSHRWPKGGEQPLLEHPRPREDEDTTRQYGTPRGVDRRFVRRDPQGGVEQGTTFVPVAARDAVDGAGAGPAREEAPWDEARARIAECKAGTLVLIHGSVLHQSKKNLSDKSRYIYTFHMIEGSRALAHYDERNWLQPAGRSAGFAQLYDPPAVPGEFSDGEGREE